MPPLPIALAALALAVSAAARVSATILLTAGDGVRSH